MGARILVVDDEPGMREVVADTLQPLHATLVVEADPRRAAEQLRDAHFDVLITDLRMPGMSGLELLKLGREHDPELPVVVVTGFPDVASAIESMKLGAIDYVTKPFHPDDLLATVARLLESRRLRAENRLLEQRLLRQNGYGPMVGKSLPMRAVFEMIDRVAPPDVDVLIGGETGTGKELVARAIHERSGRRARRFVAVNCGAMPEHLVESEFFGYERGAFTGAQARTIGLMEYADGGTLFLDEIGDLPVSMQAKLLRALQERRIRRVGGRDEIPVDVRIVAATARNLETATQAGQFRDDLFYRINVVHMTLPALRERREDIGDLARLFVERYASEMGKPLRDLEPAALTALERYDWPGNVRELQNAMRRAVALARGSALTVGDLPPQVLQPAAVASLAAPPPGLAASLPPADGSGAGAASFLAARQAFERHFWRDQLERHHGDVEAAAHEAQVPRATAYRAIKKLGLHPDDFRQ